MSALDELERKCKAKWDHLHETQLFKIDTNSWRKRIYAELVWV